MTPATCAVNSTSADSAAALEVPVTSDAASASGTDDMASTRGTDGYMHSYVLPIPPLVPLNMEADAVGVVPEPVAAPTAEAPCEVPRLVGDADSLPSTRRASHVGADEAEAQRICDASLEELRKLPEPEGNKLVIWMIWMVHRVWLNDPHLRYLNFRNLRMPRAEEEPRIAPKLMEALAANNCLTELSLCCSNLHGGKQARALSHALSVNQTLEVLNIQCNELEPDDLQVIFTGLASNKVLRELRCSDQFCEEQADRPVFATLHESLENNFALQKLGMDLTNQYYRGPILKCLIRNMEAARRRRKERGDQYAASSTDYLRRGIDKLGREKAKGEKGETGSSLSSMPGSEGSQELWHGAVEAAGA